MKINRLIPLCVLVALLTLPAGAQADFGIVPGSLSVVAENSNGTVDSQSGSHPFGYTVSFKFKTDANGEVEGGAARNIIVDLPPGLVGNPLAVPRCSRQQFEGVFAQCPNDTQVGVLNATIQGVGEARLPIFNLVPPPGVAAQIGMSTISLNTLQNASVRTEEGYGVRIGAFNVPTPIISVSETIWGVPAEAAHDSLRGIEPPNKSTARLLPFLTLPTSCSEIPQITLKADSILAPGEFVEETASTLDGGGNPAPLAGCDSVPFSPKIAVGPTTKLATNPSGLDFDLELPNDGLLSPYAISETEPQTAIVTLPEGMTVNPSFAEGVGTCTEAQYKAEQVGTKLGEGCPSASKLGSLTSRTPLLEEPIEGSLYLATPYENPFGTLSAIYIVARVPERGVLVKQAGRVDFDEATGQITTTFEDLPPLPYFDFRLHFREGGRAPLVTPPACGTYTTTAAFFPFSSPDRGTEVQSPFKVERGPEGGACPKGGLPSFHPALLAGTQNNAAGRFSPFLLNLSRKDSEQEITHFSIKLPPGVTGKLTGIPYCPDAAIEAAKARTGPHGGQEEIDDPSCPAASEVGRSLAGAGVGGVLTYVPGKVYLAGPYNGSNLSIVAITAAKAGPFDLGTVVIREALQINPETAEVFIDATGSDPIPHIIRGVPVHLRDIRAYVDRPDFVLNPTDCTRTSTASTVLGSGLDFVSEADDNPITVTSPFQAADCAALPFKPQLGLRLIGGTKRGAFPAFKAHLEMNGIGESGIAQAQVTLPKSEFIEQGHFKTICTRVQFKEGAGNGSNCPPGSIYGKARAITPLLGEPLEGPVFLRANGGERDLPDLVLALHNSQVDFNLIGFVDSVDGRLRNTFATSPDAPVSSFDLEMNGGQKGLFVNSRNLCARKYRALAGFAGQNGKSYTAKPVLRVKCKKTRHKAHRPKREGGR